MSNIKYDVKMIMSAFVDPLLRSRGWRSPRSCHGRVKIAKSIVYNLRSSPCKTNFTRSKSKESRPVLRSVTCCRAARIPASLHGNNLRQNRDGDFLRRDRAKIETRRRDPEKKNSSKVERRLSAKIRVLVSNLGLKNPHGRLIGQYRETGLCGWGARI